MRWAVSVLISAVFLLSLALAAWWSLRPRPPDTSSTPINWELAEVQQLGDLRLLSTEIATFQYITTLDPKRYLKTVIPVRVTLGMDLTKATTVRVNGRLIVTLPAVRFLPRTSDPRRWDVWEQRGPVLVDGETLSLPQLAELQAFNQATHEVDRLGLVTTAKQRAVLLVRTWLTGLGVPAAAIEIR